MRCLFVLSFILLPLLQIESSTRKLIPFPKEISTTEGTFIVTPDLQISLSSPSSQVALQATKRLYSGLSYRTKIDFSAKVGKGLSAKRGITIAFKQQALPELGTDESYKLEVGEDLIKITAQTDIGASRAVETLLQLIQTTDSVSFVPCISITDAPKYRWRGLLMDVSRHFMPVDVVKRNIDAMASVKLNVLHMHLSDDQGWRIEIKSYPVLHQKASNGEFYTQEQIKDLVQYAQIRGISIVPEIDIPGHTSALLTAFPQLASKDEKQSVASTFGIKYPVLDPTNEETYTVLTNIFREISDLFHGDFIHIGGDEVKPDHWNENPQISAFMKAKSLDVHSLQNYFIQRVADSLKQFNKEIIGWDEIFTDGLPKTAVVHCWRNKEVGYQAAKNGYKTIVSHGFYLDLLHPAKTHYLNTIIEANAALTKEQHANILGGEACMWSELVDARTVDSRLWPRLGAVAENLWSPEATLDKNDLHERLWHLSNSLNEFKLTHQGAGYAILHELSGSADIAALTELKGICEPVRGYQRHQSYQYSTSTPLNFFADATTADPPMVAPFAKAVDEFIISGKNPENFDYIVNTLYDWAGYYEYYKTYFDGNPALRKLAPLAKKLSAVAKLADEALALSVKGKIPKSDWVENAKQVLTEAKQPVEGVKLAIVDELERLMNFSRDHDVIEF